MNVYSYIKAQNYEGFDIDIVRKILIQLMQALLFLHHVGLILLRGALSIVTSNLKMSSLRKWVNQASNSLILAQPASQIGRSLPTSRVDTIDLLK
jgi:hypothetical protein